MGQLQVTISLVLIGLFTIAIIGFAVNFATDNNSAISIADDTQLNNLSTRTNSNLSGFNSNSQDTYESIVKTNIQEGSQVAQNVGSFAITPGNALGVVKNILEVSYQKIFGTNSGFGIFLTTFVGVLVFMIALFLYKTLRGVPD